jgi:hypothetical protein
VRTLNEEFEINVSLCKLKIIFEVLRERKLLDLEYRSGGSSVFVTMLPSAGKINIDESPLLGIIRAAIGK